MIGWKSYNMYVYYLRLIAVYFLRNRIFLLGIELCDCKALILYTNYKPLYTDTLSVCVCTVHNQ